MSREKSIWNSASSPNGICTNVFVGNAFMRSETSVNLCGLLDGTMERHAPAKPPLCKEGAGVIGGTPFNEPQMFAGVSERINPLVYESSQQIPIWRYAVFSHKYGKKRKANLPLTFPLSSYSASTATT